MNTTAAESMPVIILGGSDRKASVLPEEGRNKHPLTGYKGADIRLGGRPLVQIIVERLGQADAFGPIYVAGPRAVYRPAVERSPVTLIETNRSFGQNIQTSMEQVRREQPGRPVAFITCDVLPDVDELRNAMDHFADHSPCDMWCAMIRAPEERSRLGASEWKPGYRVIPEPGRPAIEILPGHLLIADPEALRLEFVYRLFEIGYRTRNRPIAFRRTAMVRGVIATLLYQDLRHLAGLRMPNLTWSVLSSGLPTGRRLKEGRVTRAELERTVRRLFVSHRHRRRYPERRVVLPILDALSLAKDVDTEEEARELGAEF
jgi:hypothetical protein